MPLVKIYRFWKNFTEQSNTKRCMGKERRIRMKKRGKRRISENRAVTTLRRCLNIYSN